MTEVTRGVVFIHSAPTALRPHVEWALSAQLRARVSLDWQVQLAEPRLWRAELVWHGAVSTGVRIAAVLREFPQLRFEVTEEPTAATEGQRYSYTPELGIFSGMISPVGDMVVPEHRLQAALRTCAGDPWRLDEAIRLLLGQPWDEALEPYRMGAPRESDTWLKQVV